MSHPEWAPLTQTAHQSFIDSGWHNVGVLLGAGVLFGLQHAVGILQMKFNELAYKCCNYIRNAAHVEYFSKFEGLQCTPFQTSGLLFIRGNS